MWSKKRLMPELPVYNEMAATLGIDAQQVPATADEIANVLASRKLDFRNSTLALAHVLGWFTFQIQQSGNDPEAFMTNVMDQTRNYCHEFSKL
jgi:hypothetical protein